MSEELRMKSFGNDKTNEGLDEQIRLQEEFDRRNGQTFFLEHDVRIFCIELFLKNN